jgi:uncharacterized membrane protein YcjF (UPF0283 family)
MDTSMFRAWWRLLRTAAIAFGVLLSFLAVVEIIRAYVFLRELSPWLAFGFIVALLGGLAWLVARFFAAFWSLPRAPAPPEVADPANLSPDEALACAGYLQHRIMQLHDNPRLSPADLQALDVLHARLRESTDVEAIQRSQDELNRLLAPLDQDAERLVQFCVRDVMAAVVLSPFRSADLLIVLYRNGRMILQLAQHYQTRPTPGEQLRIFRDVLAIVATVNFLNFTEKFVEQLFQGVPLLGSLAGDLTQGVGAGLLTSAAGHAAIQRCRSIDPWSRRAAQEDLAHRMPRFAKDVKAIFSAEVLPRLRPRMPDFKYVSDRISAAFDSALNNMGAWVWRPVTTRGAAFAATTLRGGASAWRGIQSGTRGVGQWLSVFGRRRSRGE